MTTQQLIFWFLSALAVFSAIMVITRKNPVYSVLYLIITFFAISGHYVLLNAQFLAIVNIIVYAGAIMVLFLFVLMLMNLNKESEPQKNKYMLWSATIAGCCMMFMLINAIRPEQDVKVIEGLSGGAIGLVKNLGMRLYTDYLVPFELSTILFLSAMIGAVIIGKKD